MKRLGWIERDLFIIICFTLLMCPLVAFTSGAARVVVGVLFVLFIPGYVLVSALFPKTVSLSGVERLALSLGLSFALVALGGLALNYTPLGIRLIPFMAMLVLFVVLMSGVAWYRRRRTPREYRFTPNLAFGFPSVALSWAGQGRLSKTLTLLVVVSTLGALGMAGYMITNPKPGERFTEFYILGSGKKAVFYQRQLVQGESAMVIAGIVNHEYQRMTYRLEIAIDEQKVKAVDSIVLEHQQKWEQSIDWTPVKVGDQQEVKFLLYEDADAIPYRTARLWIDVQARP